jgi:hypothetical protein
MKSPILRACGIVVTALFALASSAAAQTACKVVYTISPQNSTAFGAGITIENTGTVNWSSWTLTWAFPNGQTVSSLWNGNETQSGANVTVTNESYNGSIAAGGSYAGVGFNGTWNGVTNNAPASFAVNGTTCGGSATGSFSLTPAAATETLAPGASVSDGITVTDLNGFTGAVTLTAASSNSGVTATVNGSAIALTASATATGTSTITVTGTSGTLKETTSIAVTISSGMCTPTAITPYLQVNGAAWQNANAASVPTAATVNLGPQPVSGTWSWTGPKGFTSTTRQINAIALSAGANVYVATYTNSAGCKSTETFTITEAGSTGSFTLTPASSAETVDQGASVTDTITVTDLSGFTGTVSLAATSSNAGVTASVSGDVVALTASATATGSATITVTGTSGSLTPVTTNIAVTVNSTSSADATVTVNPSNPGIAVSDMLLGMNMAAWYDVTTAGVSNAFQAAGIKAVRWPGGSWGDAYNWETNTECGSTANANDTYSNFVNDLVKPAGLDVSLIADYGTGENCTGYGNPAEAASWASESLTLGANVSHITVGNEEYGSWETDNHPIQHDPTTYANAVATGYYPDIKAVSPNVLVGVLVQPDYSPWDSIVMADAKYDFVEFHYYPETPGQEDDTTLVQQDAQGLTTYINRIKTELASSGHSISPIYVGEIGGPYSNPGKQSWSITQGLYAGQVLGEMMNDGVTRLTWWIGFGNCNGQAGNDSSSVYGFQDFGAYNVFSDGPSDTTCPNAGPIGTMNPTARAFQLFSQVLLNGEHVLTPTVTGDTTDVRAYAATNSGGTALVLFNDNENNNETVEINLNGKTTSTSVTETTYDKAIYAESANGVWAAPTTTNLGASDLPLTLTLSPWSMNVVIIH